MGKLVSMDHKNENNLKDITKELVTTYAPVWFSSWLRRMMQCFQEIYCIILTMGGKNIKNRLALTKNKRKTKRYLEIGPGDERLPGFETMNIIGGFLTFWQPCWICVSRSMKISQR